MRLFMKKFLVIILCSLSLSANAITLDELTNRAKSGELAAQCTLASKYKDGYGVAQNYGKAVYWYQQGANQGGISATLNLADMYFMGQGVPKNYKKALDLILPIASNYNDAFSQSEVALIYAKGGYGVQQDLAKSFQWYLKAAQQTRENPLKSPNYDTYLNSAKQMVAVLYYKGEGVPRNIAKAKEWAYKACQENSQSCTLYKKISQS